MRSAAAMGTRRRIRCVPQEHDTGCAVACVASVAGVSYRRAALSVKGRSFGNMSATWTEMMRGLRKLGFKCRLVRGERFRRLKSPAVLMFAWDRSYGLGSDTYHCIVWDPRRSGALLDPALCCLPARYYIEQWRKLGKEALVVTGKREKRR